MVKQLLKQPVFYLALWMVGCSAGSLSNRDVTVTPEAIAPTQSAPLQSTTPTSQAQPAVRTDNPDYVAQVVQQVGDAVVRINSSRTVQQSQNPVIDRFFGGDTQPQERVQRGTGSGFIISQDGQVVTNAHVVAGADRVTVILRDGRRFEGEVVGVDRVTDTAVVKIKATGLPTVKLGNSDNLQPGQAAIAIGNPLGLDNTVTQGIVSATGRSSADVGVPAERVEFIQTDAAINPGNSGGPLLNAAGEVIGMNTAIIQGAQGLGFAIPVNTFRRIAEQLITKGRADHPYLGVQMAELSPELRSQINQSNAGFKVNQDTGVIVVAVAENSPAARGGVRPGDVIESVNGVTIQNSRQVQQEVEKTTVGNTLQVTINRSGKPQTIAIKPSQLPEREPS
ncbi:HhoA/HhoB/HtrA family serine endopeptidase [Phormidesmis priestleyi]